LLLLLCWTQGCCFRSGHCQCRFVNTPAQTANPRRMKSAARGLRRAVCRNLSSRSELLRGARALQTPEDRAKRERDSVGAAQRAANYERDDVTARILREQAARHARLADDRADTASGGGGVTNLALEAKFAQMEREGEFKNLAGSGKPLADRPATHFGGEDAMDRCASACQAWSGPF
jgi:hypothetical protein